jgi:hypothetical protein
MENIAIFSSPRVALADTASLTAESELLFSIRRHSGQGGAVCRVKKLGHGARQRRKTGTPGCSAYVPLICRVVASQ